MSLEGAVASFGSAIIGAVFTFLVFQQWLSHRKAYQAAWSIGLAMFSIAALMQGFAETYGWNAGIYKVYYFVAAPLVAVLGVGSAFLASRRGGLAFALYTSILAAAFAWVVSTATVNVAAFNLPLPAGQGFDESVRLWSPLFTVPGSLALIGIALVSYWRTRLTFNVWIGVGGIVAAASGSLATFGVTWALYLGELIGIALMFRGFLASREPQPAARPTSEQVPSA
ncbi:MAG TPA: hypothetical protein VEY12_07845 [Thermoplasmata archaeon]|nr:hypothetical protein [Thermoplasmata archaeon]